VASVPWPVKQEEGKRSNTEKGKRRDTKVAEFLRGMVPRWELFDATPGVSVRVANTGVRSCRKNKSVKRKGLGWGDFEGFCDDRKDCGGTVRFMENYSAVC